MRASFVGFLLLAACTAQSPRVQELSAPVSGEALLLVGNKGENSLSFIDLQSGKELGRVPTGPQPHEIAISPDGRLAAAVAYGGNTIDIVDVRRRERVRTVDLGTNGAPHGIVWLADGRLVVATGRSQAVTVVDPRSGAVSPIVTGQRGSHMIAVSPDGRTAYAANIGSGTVSVVDLGAGRKLRDLSVGGRPEGITLTGGGRVLWVGDNDGARVQAYDTRSFERLAELPTGQLPIRVVATPDERWVVTSNNRDGNLTVIDAGEHAVARTIPVSATAEAGQVTLLFSPDGRRLYVAETGRDQVAELDWPGGSVLRRLPAGRQSDGLAIVP